MKGGVARALQTSGTGCGGRVDALAATLGIRAAPPPAPWPSSSPGVAPATGETEASSRSGTAAAGRGVEPATQPASCGHRRVARRVDGPGPMSPGRTRSRRRHPATPALRISTVPAKPRWLLTIPDAISQLENLDRQFLTRRDIERLFGVGKVRAAAS